MKYQLYIAFLLTHALVSASPYLVDFDTSMGVTNAYYKKLLKKFNKPNYLYGLMGLKLEYYAIRSRIKNTYNEQRFALTQKSGSPRIPKVFHQIWVGPKPFPEKYKLWQKTWQTIPGWRYKLWTDKEVAEFPLINRTAYENEKNLGARADILRLEILYKEGGVYVDTDFECIKPEMFDVLNSSYDFYCGLHPIDCKAFLVNNAIIGSIPKHPILKACIDQLPYAGNNVSKPSLRILLKGPALLSAMTSRLMGKVHKDMVLPASFFYPLGVYQMRNNYSYMPFNTATFERVKRDVVKPETIALHWWDGSWLLPTAILRSYALDEEL